MAGKFEHPEPTAHWETSGYWEGAARGELVLQRCLDCGRVQHRPRAICAHCLSGAIEHFAASGRGRVYTFTVTHQNQMPAFRQACPYVLAYVELEEGPRIMTHIVGCDPEEVEIEQDVVVDFAPCANGLAVPRFRPA